MQGTERKIERCADKDAHLSHVWGRNSKCPGLARTDMKHHIHADRHVLAPGKCPACDAWWDGFGS